MSKKTNVRHAIAAFEAHNETVRKATPPVSPARGAGEGEEVSQMGSFDPTSITSIGGGGGGGDIDHHQHPNHHHNDMPFDIPYEGASRRSDTGSVTSGHSASGLASLSRRNRLIQQQQLSPSSVEFSSKTVSLVERRKARQQRKEQLLMKRSGGRRSGSSSVERRESRHTPPANPPPRSSQQYQQHHQYQQQHHQQHRQQPPDPMISNRRFVHTISAESDNQDEGPQSRMSPSPKQRRQITTTTTAHTHMTAAAAPNDDDDNTAFANSVLTIDHTDDDATLTSVRQIMTSPPSRSRKEQQQAAHHHHQQTVLQTASSSSCEADTRQVLYNQAAVSSRSSGQQQQQQQQQQRYTNHNQTNGGATTADDDDTLDYADILDDDHNSIKEKQQVGGGGFLDSATSPLINTNDMEHFRQSLNTPVAKTGMGIVAAATVGSILLGPVGLLVGAATVGIGVGVLQIPDEQRANMKDKAKQTLHRAHDSALNASETLSSSCATTCQNHGITADQLPSEMKNCFSTHDEVAQSESDQNSVHQQVERKGSSHTMVNTSSGGLPSFIASQEGNSQPASSRKRRAACLRKVRITPVDQIHGLAPHLQPRAWLEVLASANTTPDEKSEAMEEVLIVAKDKRHARILLEEGILDSLLFILNRYFDKKQRNENNNIATATKIEIREVTRAKLAANCCLTLGKAHCAAVHTEGDLLLMSMYERGTVPEERQLAQMLYEVPHHVLSQEPDVFVIQQTTMSAAETLANSIKDLATAARTR